jgi:hypothetical protein
MQHFFSGDAWVYLVIGLLYLVLFLLHYSH